MELENFRSRGLISPSLLDDRLLSRAYFAPLLRVAEAVGRLIWLPSFYDSFWDAFSSEMWFSPAWSLYTSTTFGWWTLLVLVLWIVAIPTIAVLPFLQWRVAFVFVIASGCVLAVLVGTFRLEFQLAGMSQSEMVWRLRSRDPEIRRRAAQALLPQLLQVRRSGRDGGDRTARLARRGAGGSPIRRIVFRSTSVRRRRARTDHGARRSRCEHSFVCRPGAGERQHRGRLRASATGRGAQGTGAGSSREHHQCLPPCGGRRRSWSGGAREPGELGR